MSLGASFFVATFITLGMTVARRAVRAGIVVTGLGLVDRRNRGCERQLNKRCSRPEPRTADLSGATVPERRDCDTQEASWGLDYLVHGPSPA